MKNYEIDGDANVGRNLHARRVRVRENATVGGDMRVEGWLEARNLKGSLKGLYGSVEKLEESWPRPDTGWFALVGDTLPATLWRAEGKRWVNCGVAPETFTVDMVQIKEQETIMREELEETGERVEGLEGDMSRVLETVFGEITKISWTDFTEVNMCVKYLSGTPVAEPDFAYLMVECEAGDVFEIVTVGGNNAKAWMFLRADGSVVSYYSGTAGTFNGRVTAPKGATRLAVNCMVSGYGNFRVVRNPDMDEESLVRAVEDTKERLGPVEETLGRVSQCVFGSGGNEWSDFTAQDKCVMYTTGLVSSEPDWAYLMVECEVGDVFEIATVGGNNAKAWMFLRADGSVVSYYTGTAGAFKGRVKVPKEATKVVINCRVSGYDSFRVIKNPDVVSESLLERVRVLETQRYEDEGMYGRTCTTQSTGYPGTNINTARYVADLRMKWKDGDRLEKVRLNIANVSPSNTVMSRVLVFDSQKRLKSTTNLGVLTTPGTHEFDVSEHNIEVNEGWYVAIRGLGYKNQPNDNYFYDFEAGVFLPDYAYSFDITVSRKCLSPEMLPMELLEECVESIITQTAGRKLKVLCLGNSFTQDALGYVPFIVEKLAPGMELTVGMACIDGAGLVQQCASLTGRTQYLEGTAYTPKLYAFYKHIAGTSAWGSASGRSAESVLTDEEWDVVTMQQNGGNAFKDFDVYYRPYLAKAQLAALPYLKAGVRFGWLLTHGAYSESAEILRERWQGTAENTVKVTEQSMTTEVFAYGTAVENLRSVLNCADTAGLMADTFHLQEGIGCLCAAYAMVLWLMQLAGVETGVLGESTRPDAAWVSARGVPGAHYGSSGTVVGISESNCRLAQIAAQEAYKNPYRVTDLSIYRED